MISHDFYKVKIKLVPCQGAYLEKSMFDDFLSFVFSKGVSRGVQVQVYLVGIGLVMDE